MAEATVTLGGAILATEKWRWVMVEGAKSPEIYIDVDNHVDEELQGASNPVTLTAETKRADGDRGSGAHSLLNVSDIHLIARRRLDPWVVRWVMVDQRWLFRNVLVGGAFNVTRRSNDVREADVQRDIDNLLAQDATVRKYRYLPSTLRAPGAKPPQHFAPSIADMERNVGELWTALQIVEWILAIALVRAGLPKIRYRIEAQDNGYVREDWVIGGAGAPMPAVLDEALNLARAGLYVADDGTWTVFDLAAAPIDAKVGGYQNAGVLVREEMKRQRPKSFILRFLADHEILLEFVESGTDTRNQDDPDIAMRTLENVAAVPSTFTAGGVEYLVGTYHPIFTLIKAYDKAGWPTGNTIGSFAALRKYKLTPGVGDIHLCADAGTGGYDQTAIARFRSLLTAYRTVYRIPQPLIDATTVWHPRRASLLDAVTGQQQPSPVWSDYSIVPTGKVKIRKNAPTKFASQNVAFPDNLATGAVAPLHLSVIDPDLGIVAVSPIGDDKSGRASQVIAARLLTPLSVSIDNLHSEGSMEVKTLHPQHRVATIITVRFRNDTSASRYALRAHASSYGINDADGPPYESAIVREPARFEWRINETSLELDGAGGFQVKNARLLNSSVLGAIAKAEGQRLYYSYADRYVGRFERAGYESGVDRPRGNVRAVVVDFDKGKITTTYHLPEAAPAPDLQALLPDFAKSYIFRMIDRSL